MPPEVAFERFLRDKHERKETKYRHISGRVAIEDLPHNHLYRWFADWMDLQLSDIGVNSTGGVALPTLHFELVRADNGEASAHTFESGEWGFIVITQPLFDEMLTLSRLLVDQNIALFNLQIAPEARAKDIIQLLLLMQFCFVTSHEYSHLVRLHLADQPPHADELGEALCQAQELDADGYGIYHDLAYFFDGAGRPLAARLLNISSVKALENFDSVVLPLGGDGSVLCPLGRENPDRVRSARGTSAPAGAHRIRDPVHRDVVQGSGSHVHRLDDGRHPERLFQHGVRIVSFSREGFLGSAHILAQESPSRPISCPDPARHRPPPHRNG
jgi:hypothetical protein